MKHFCRAFGGIVLVAAVCLNFIFLVFFSCWIYTTVQLRAARVSGVFASAVEGMYTRVAEGYLEPREVEIIYAGSDSFDGSQPHVRYMTACVWADWRIDGSVFGSQTCDYDVSGSLFLNTKDGWVYIPEGAFPEFIGFWIRVYGLGGEGLSQTTREWDPSDWTECNHEQHETKEHWTVCRMAVQAANHWFSRRYISIRCLFGCRCTGTCEPQRW